MGPRRLAGLRRAPPGEGPMVRSLRRNLGLLALLLLLGSPAAFPPARAASQPSFDCARVTSTVNRLVCATPELGALDRRLNDDFHNTLRERGEPASLFWSVDGGNRELVREPLGVLDGPGALRCHEPETGD